MWWAYYQTEPFGGQWEQTSTIAAMVSANTSMIAATRGAKHEPATVMDFMPADSLSWVKRNKRKSTRVTSPVGQAALIKHAFGFK